MRHRLGSIHGSVSFQYGLLTEPEFVAPRRGANSPPGLSRRERSPPMSFLDCTHRKSRRAGRRRIPRPRRRRCLLKGCERRFRPQRAQERYCSLECRLAARKWAVWKNQRKYRATAAGRAKRNGQSRRYRERVASRKATPEEPEAPAEPAEPPSKGCEGHHSKIFFDHSCDRPGCYNGLVRTRRSPAQRFCSHACRRAMERVWQREQRWRLSIKRQWRR